eukprot:GILJ01005487.1.p1 GENE.GILJ01005487.1~~GILJ01005487.1.p1  ORF type:complete len:495 (-),score=40.28 GILJ01005487.1:182-1666(-)
MSGGGFSTFLARTLNPFEQSTSESVFTRSVSQFCFEVGAKLPLDLKEENFLRTVGNVIHLKKGTAAVRKYITRPKSCQVFRDVFWFLFCRHFQPNSHEQQDYLQNQLSQNFVSFFLSIETPRNSVLDFYPFAIAQAVFQCFYETFPASRHLFDSVFSQAVYQSVLFLLAGVRIHPVTVKCMRQQLFGEPTSTHVKKTRPTFQDVVSQALDTPSSEDRKSLVRHKQSSSKKLSVAAFQEQLSRASYIESNSSNKYSDTETDRPSVRGYETSRGDTTSRRSLSPSTSRYHLREESVTGRRSPSPPPLLDLTRSSPLAAGPSISQSNFNTSVDLDYELSVQSDLARHKDVFNMVKVSPVIQQYLRTGDTAGRKAIYMHQSGFKDMQKSFSLPALPVIPSASARKEEKEKSVFDDKTPESTMWRTSKKFEDRSKQQDGRTLRIHHNVSQLQTLLDYDSAAMMNELKHSSSSLKNPKTSKSISTRSSTTLVLPINLVMR